MADHHRNVKDPEFVLSRVRLGVDGWDQAWQTMSDILMVDVEKQGSIFQPLLPPANVWNLFGVARYFCK